jgi:hypothetical protein
VPFYSLHDTAGESLGLLDAPATTIEPGDFVVLEDGRDARVTARVETNDERVWAVLEVLVAPSSPHIPTWRGVEFPSPRRLRRASNVR